MVSPKPVSLTQVDAEDYDGVFEPQPLVVVGPIPGGGGGGGAVNSVNGKTGTVVLNATDVGATTKAYVDSVSISPAQLHSPLKDPGAEFVLVVNGGESQWWLTSPNIDNYAIVQRNATGNILASTPTADAHVAPKGYVDSSVVGLAPYTALNAVGETALEAKNTADEALSLAEQAVPTSRTVAGKALTADVTLAKGDVGLGNVDNTSDANKPVSTATTTQLNLKAPLASPAFTGTPTGITKAHVGLGNVDNTSDANKPVSTAQASAIAAKVGSPNSTVTGVAYYPTVASLPATGTAGVIYYVDAV